MTSLLTANVVEQTVDQVQEGTAAKDHDNHLVFFVLIFIILKVFIHD